MFTASRARFLTRVRGLSTRFVEFTVAAFEAARNDHKAGLDSSSADLWVKFFAGTRYGDRESAFAEDAAEVLLCQGIDALHYYLADAIAWALWRTPEAAKLMDKARKLAADDDIEIDFAVRQVAWNEAEKLSNRGFSQMVAFLER